MKSWDIDQSLSKQFGGKDAVVWVDQLRYTTCTGIGKIIMISALVVYPRSLDDQGEQLLLQHRNVWQLDFAGVEGRLKGLVEFRLVQRRYVIGDALVAEVLLECLAGIVVADHRVATIMPKESREFPDCKTRIERFGAILLHHQVNYDLAACRVTDAERCVV